MTASASSPPRTRPASPPSSRASRRFSPRPLALPRPRSARLRPYAGGAPQVAAEVEIDGRRYEIAKRWLSRPFARVTELPTGRLVAQDDAAERWIRDRAAGADGTGLFWVRQGLLAFEPEGRHRGEGRAGAPARRPPRAAFDGCPRGRGHHRRPPHGRHRRPMRGRPREARHLGRQPKTGGPWRPRSTRPATCATSATGSTAFAAGWSKPWPSGGRLRPILWPPPIRPRSTRVPRP